MLSDRVFQSILPPNDRELCPYEDVFTFGIWRSFFILKYTFKANDFLNSRGFYCYG